jgi:hypothetical protein
MKTNYGLPDRIGRALVLSAPGRFESECLPTQPIRVARMRAASVVKNENLTRGDFWESLAWLGLAVSALFALALSL